MDWRSDGGRWLEAAAGRSRRLLHPARRRQQAPFDEPQPRHPHRGRAARSSRTAAGSPPRSASSRADRDRPPGPRRRARLTRLRSARPLRRARLRRPRGRRHVIPSPAWRRSSSSPTACPSPSPGRAEPAILHCGWRGLAAGIVARGAAAVGATDAAIGPASALLLRGRRRGARRLRRSGTASPRSHARPRRGRPPPARAGRRRAGRVAGLCTSCEGSSSSPTGATRPYGAPGGARLARGER